MGQARKRRHMAAQCALIPANLITFAHFSVSARMILPKSAGVFASAGVPRSASRALIFGSASAAFTSVLSFAMISAGVAFGAHSPLHELAS